MYFPSLPFFMSHCCRPLKGNTAFSSHTSRSLTFVHPLPSAMTFPFQLSLFHFQMSKFHLIFPSSNAISSVKSSIVLIARMEFILTSLTSKAFLYTYLSLLFLLCICFVILCKTEVSLWLRLYSVQSCSRLLFLIHQSNLIFIENLVFPF